MEFQEFHALFCQSCRANDIAPLQEEQIQDLCREQEHPCAVRKREYTLCFQREV